MMKAMRRIITILVILTLVSGQLFYSGSGVYAAETDISPDAAAVTPEAREYVPGYSFFEGIDTPPPKDIKDLPSYVNTAGVNQEILDNEKYIASYPAGGGEAPPAPVKPIDTEPIDTEADGPDTSPPDAQGGVSALGDMDPPSPPTPSAPKVSASGPADAKSYPEAPFGYNYTDNETVGLNSGSMQYDETDFVLPGRNGFDINISRTYDSSSSNPEEATVRKVDMTTYYYYYVVYYFFIAYRTVTSTSSETHSELNPKTGQYEEKTTTSSHTYKVPYIDIAIVEQGSDGLFKRKAERDSAQAEYKKTLQSQYASHPDYVIIVKGGESTGPTWQTGTRVNNHADNVFGLGYGWSLGFPSIEAIEDTESGKKNDFLHVGDGRVYQIDFTTANGLKGYDLNDLVVKKNADAGFSYTLTFKDGRKAFFDKSKKLVRMEDRFKNRMDFYYNNGSVLNIVDSAGRDLKLNKTATGLRWVLNDPAMGVVNQVLVEYTVKDHLLTAVKDQEGRVTEYSYDQGGASTRMLEARIDDPVATEYNLLKEIRRPTGAVSVYMYTKRSNLTYGEKGVTDKWLVSSRSDFLTQSDYENRGKIDKRVNYERYTYTFSNADKKDDYQLYISSANRFRPNGMVETHTFNIKGHRTKEVDKYRNILTDTKTFTYDKNGLMTKESGEKKGGGSVKQTYSKTWTYDAWGNVLSSTDELGNVTKTTYNTTYSLPTRVTTPKDSDTNIVTVNTLDEDGKLVTETIVYEVTGSSRGNTLQKTGYGYGDNSVLEKETRYYGADLSDSYTTSYAYDNRYLFMKEKSVEGVSVGDAVRTVKESYSYDAFGRVTSYTDMNGNTTLSEYDKLGRKTKDTYPDGTSTATVYNDAENKVTVTDELGNRTVYLYTPLGQISRVIEGNSGTALMAYQYDMMLRPVYELSLDAGGVKSAKRMVYDYLSRVTSTVVTGRASDGSLTNVLSDESVLYQDVYSSKLSRTVTVVKGDDASQNVVTSQYTDLLGRVVQAGRFTDGRECIDTFTYDKAGNQLTSLTDRSRSLGLPYTTMSEYDYAGHVTAAYNALGNVARSEYDALGRLISSRDYKGEETTYRYDGLDRMIEMRSPFEGGSYSVTKTGYDGNGNVTRTETSSGLPGGPEEARVTEYSYDSRGRLVQAKAQNGGGDEYTGYGYDAKGNLTDVYTGGKMSGGSVAYLSRQTAAYDCFGNVTERTDGLGQKESYAYDIYGVLTGKTDRNGNVTSFVYDGLGRATGTTVVSGPGSSFPGAVDAISTEYTLTGQVKSTTGGSGAAAITLSYRYGSLGQVVSEREKSREGEAIKVYRYDTAGNRTGMNALDGGGVMRSNMDYTYDEMNRLVTVYSDGDETASYRYDLNGNRESTRTPAGTTAYTYNKANMVTSMTNSGPDGAILSSFNYEYSLDGNQVSKKENVLTSAGAYAARTTDYEYDGLGRLTLESENWKDSATGEPQSAARAYSFDASGNRAAMRESGTEKADSGYEAYTEYSYDANNRLLTSTKTADNGAEIVTTYTYDCAGNQLSQITEVTGPATGGEPEIGFTEGVSGFEQMQYDGLNRLVSSLTQGADGAMVQVSYAYRPDGLRHSKTSDGGTTTHLWDGSNIIADLASDGTTTRYIRGAGLIARQENSGGDNPGALEYYIKNAHGDVVQIVSGAGTVLKGYSYSSFGVEQNIDPADTNVFRYSGEYYDQETGTIYLRARAYNPYLGRFTQEDSNRGKANDPLSLNLYTYCHNDPVNFTDPSGNTEETAKKWAEINHKPVLLPGYTPGFDPATAPEYYFKNKEEYDRAMAIWSNGYWNEFDRPWMLQVNEQTFFNNTNDISSVDAQLILSLNRLAVYENTTIVLRDGFRTHAQQAEIHKNHPGTSNSENHSWHEYGAAVDIGMLKNGVDVDPTFRLTAAQYNMFGLCRPAVGEAWHFQLSGPVTGKSSSTNLEEGTKYNNSIVTWGP